METSISLFWCLPRPSLVWFLMVCFSMAFFFLFFFFFVVVVHIINFCERRYLRPGLLGLPKPSLGDLFELKIYNMFTSILLLHVIFMHLHINLLHYQLWRARILTLCTFMTLVLPSILLWTWCPVQNVWANEWFKRSRFWYT